MAWYNVGSLAISAYGAYSKSQADKKAASTTAAGSTGGYQPLDISKIIADARSAAETNISTSINLENQYLPGTAALRTTTNNALQTLGNGTGTGTVAQNSLLSQIGTSNATNPLLQESANRIMDNLRLGGHLGQDAQSAAVQGALQQGGASGISGSGAGRGLVARDLGLTSIGLENQRIGAAQSAGATQAQLAQSDYASRLGLATGAAGQQAQQSGLLASLVDARAYPNAGLDPGSIASLYVGQNNAQNQYNLTAAAIAQQQRNQNLNGLLGFGSTAISSGVFGKVADYFKNNNSTATDGLSAGGTGLF